jgi:hypothetical protein
MSSMRFNARFGTSHHGPQHPFNDAGVVVDSLTDIYSAMMKYPFVIDRSCIYKGV